MRCSVFNSLSNKERLFPPFDFRNITANEIILYCNCEMRKPILSRFSHFCFLWGAALFCFQLEMHFAFYICFIARKSDSYVLNLHKTINQ